MLSGQVPGIQVLSAPEAGTTWQLQTYQAAVPTSGAISIQSPKALPPVGTSSTSSSQAPCLGTREPSDLGWAGLGPAGIDFGSGVGFLEQIYGTGRAAERQLNLSGEGIPATSGSLRGTQTLV